ncbi:MAG: class I SAM-dependent methyltransferase [Nitrospirota bacterium]
MSRNRPGPEVSPGRPALEPMTCPLCANDDARWYYHDGRRDYHRCGACGLVFVPPLQFLSAEEEKKRYDLHRNSPDDPDYRRFLSRLFIPLQQRLARGSSGLDFGSGPAPTLSRMFEEAGHTMTIFDHFYEHVPAALERRYDFITATEVVEHLHGPRRELERLWACLNEGGWLGVMTAHAVPREAFPGWHYKNDPTHVCFFSPPTFSWLALQWNAEVTFAEGDVVLFRKRSGLQGPRGRAVRGGAP